MTTKKTTSGCSVHRIVRPDFFGDGVVRTAKALAGKPEELGGKQYMKVETDIPHPADKKYRLHFVPLAEWDSWPNAKLCDPESSSDQNHS